MATAESVIFTDADLHFVQDTEYYKLGKFLPAIGHIRARIRVLSGGTLGVVVKEKEKYIIHPLKEVIAITQQFLDAIQTNRIVPFTSDTTTWSQTIQTLMDIGIVQKEKKVQWYEIEWNNNGMPTELIFVFTHLPNHLVNRQSLFWEKWINHDTIYANYALMHGYIKVEKKFENLSDVYIHKSKFLNDTKFEITQPLPFIIELCKIGNKMYTPIYIPLEI